MRILAVLIASLAVSALAADTISGASYSFVKPNTKNYIYKDVSAPVSVTVSSSSFAKDGALKLKFQSVDSGSWLDVTATSACLDANNVEVFRLSDGLFAVDDIKAATTCTFTGAVLASSLGVVYDKLGLDASNAFAVTPTFTSKSALFEGIWAHQLVHDGDVNTLTVRSDIAFDQADTFIITANNGAPFAAVDNACRKDNGDGTTTPLFSVSAQGSRLVFSARDALNSAFECTVRVTAAPTSLHKSFTFAAPLHGITRPTEGFVCALDHGDFHMRMGFLGSTSRDDAHHASANALYLALPASTVRAGEPIKVHFREIEDVELTNCKYKNGGAAGTMKMIVDPQPIAKSRYSSVMALAGPVLVNAEKFVELICDIAVARDDEYKMKISAVSVSGGFFAASRFDLGLDELEAANDLFHNGVAAMVVSYNNALNMFALNLTHHDSANMYINSDISFQGVSFVDVADVMAKCAFGTGEKPQQTWTPPNDLISVVDGQVHFHVNAYTLAGIEEASIICNVDAAVGTELSVYDNVLGRQIAKDIVHDGALSLTFGDGEQTHYMAFDSISGDYHVPFTLHASKLHSESAAEKAGEVNIAFNSFDMSIFPSGGVGESYELQCSTGVVESDSKAEHYSSNSQEIEYANNVFTIKHGFDAHCTGAAKLRPYTLDVDASRNLLHVFTDSRHDHRLATFKKNYNSVVHVPQIVSKQQFSFIGANVVVENAATFTVGHTLLAAGNTVEFTFDHDIMQSSATCAYNAGPAVLNCVLAANKRTLTCTKQDIAESNPCDLSITFGADFTRKITVSTAFTGLPVGMVFKPTFFVPVQGIDGSVSVSAASVAQQLTAAFTFPRVPRPDDVIKVSVVNNEAGRLEFMSIEPSVVGVANPVSVHDGFMYIPLTSLDAGAATVDNLKVHFHHVAKPGQSASASFDLSIVHDNSGNVLIDDQFVFDATTLFVGVVPSAASALYNVVKINHPDMALGDTLSFNELTYPPADKPKLYCDGQAEIVAVDNTFTLAAAATASQPCYAYFPAYTLAKNYWSFTATINTVPTTFYAVAKPSAAAVARSGALVQQIAATVTLIVPDFTSKFIGGNSDLVFSFDKTQMDVTAITCASVSGSVDPSASTAKVTFTVDSVPLSSYGNLTCNVSVTPKLVVAAPVFSSVSVFGRTLPNIALRPFQAAYNPVVKVHFPSPVVAKDSSHTVTFTTDQLEITDKDTIAIASAIVGDFITIDSCVDPAKASSGVIGFLAAYAGSAPALTFTCVLTFKYVSYEPVPIKLQFTKDATGAITEFDAVAPVSAVPGFVLNHVATTDTMAVYKSTYFSLTPATQNLEFRLDFADYWYDVSLDTDCSNSLKLRTQLYVPVSVTQEQPLVTCEIRVVFKADYIPHLVEKEIELYTSGDGQSIKLPVVKSAQPKIVAGVFNGVVSFSFNNADSKSVTIDNIWGLTESVKVYSYDEGQLEAVGQVTVSADGRTLVASISGGVIFENNNKYTVYPCYFPVKGLFDQPLQAFTAFAKFSVGSLSTVVRTSENLYSIVAPPVSDAILTPGQTYDVAFDMIVAGNKAKVVLDYTNTAFTSVVGCFVSTQALSPVFSIPANITTAGTTVAIALTEKSVVSGLQLSFGVKCTFNTMSAAAVESKAGHFAKTIRLSVRSALNSEFFSAPVAVAIPYVAPINVVAHVVSFQRSELFTSSELAALARQYASGLRAKVANLKDDQIAVTRQQLVDTPAPYTVAVPAPITTQFLINANTAVEITFATTTTTAVPVSTTDVNGAAADITSAFTTYSATPLVADMAIIDGSCSTRCGLGCTLCAQGEACSTNGDCIDGYCGAAGYCGMDVTPNSAAAVKTVSMAVLAVVATLLML